MTEIHDMESAPLDRPILVWWPIVLIDEETGVLSDTEVDGAWLVSEWNGGHWLEPDVLNALNSVAFDDDREYAAQPAGWRELPPDASASKAALDVLTERGRQRERWSPEHDDEHDDGSLALAAIAYAAPVPIYRRNERSFGIVLCDPWPDSWGEHWDNRYRYGERKTNPGNTPASPSTYTDEERRDLLVKSAALLIAEIERLDRKTAREESRA